MDAARVLAIGGSDPAGNTGVQTDLRAMNLSGVNATAVLTSLAPPSANVFRHPGRAYAAAVREQMAELRGVDITAIKTGVLPAPEVVAAVVLEIGQYSGVPIVVDVVTSGGGGNDGADEATIDAIRFDLVPLATVVSTSLSEAEDLVGGPLSAQSAVSTILAMGPEWVVLKDAGNSSTEWEDLLSDGNRWFALRTARGSARTSAGDAGAAFAAALAAGLARGLAVPDAAGQARRFVVDESAAGSPPGTAGG
ncbi:MAG: hydroxymethylpyrimidine/phosphomethylpyrimidine kinase [Chloroflexota bacterium]|jgi:hydroxymethylpyrimidine/phosphomethylpyrimidine kinase|nr:hydroxymethylpyrimidine/phosphomethylpyrimidine kinase [Chloroflexota bacterium]